MILGIQLLGLGFCLIVIYLTYLHYKKNEFKPTEFFSWTILWLGFGFIILFPEIVDFLLKPLHIVRAMDFFMVIGFLVLFGIVFYLYTIVKKNDKKIEEIVRKEALKGLK